MASTSSFLQLPLPQNLPSRSLNNNNNNLSSRRSLSLCFPTSISSSPISVKSNLFGDSNNHSSRENANAGVCFGSGCHAMVVVDEDEPEEDIIRRFKREVSKAGIIPELRRRKHYENKQEEKKRKLREAGKRNRRRKFEPRTFPGEGEDEIVAKKNDDDDDNWDMPAGGLPF